MVLGGSSPVFGGEGQLGAAPAHVEIGVTPAVQFTGAAQGLAGPGNMSILSGVVNDQNCELECALELAQVGQQRRDL